MNRLMIDDLTTHPDLARHLTPHKPLALGTMTAWGEIVGYSLSGGERYYFCLDAEGVTSFMPVDVVDNSEGNISRRYGL